MRPINGDSFPHLLTVAVETAQWRGLDLLAHLSARWWGIDVGRACRFYGLPIFRRFPTSVIRIEDGCQFRSSRWSNLAGLNRPCMVSTLGESARIEIGASSGLSATVIGAASHVRIGKRVMCGANVTITDTDWHPIDEAKRLSGGAGASAPVDIGDGVWLSMNVTVLKGVTIGPGTVVAAGSVVSKTLPGGVLAGGVPARVLRSL